MFCATGVVFCATGVVFCATGVVRRFLEADVKLEAYLTLALPVCGNPDDRLRRQSHWQCCLSLIFGAPSSIRRADLGAFLGVVCLVDTACRAALRACRFTLEVCNRHCQLYQQHMLLGPLYTPLHTPPLFSTQTHTPLLTHPKRPRNRTISASSIHSAWKRLQCTSVQTPHNIWLAYQDRPLHQVLKRLSTPQY